MLQIGRGLVFRERRGLRHVVGADDQRHVGAFEFGVDFVHIVERVVRNVGFGQQNVHVPGHAAGVTGMDRVLHLDAALPSSDSSSLTECCACATAMP